MTYEEYMKLLEEGDKRVREMGRQAREAGYGRGRRGIC